MATGSGVYGTILVTGEPRGRVIEGYITTARYPGIVVKYTTTAPVLGRYSFIPWATNAPIMILLEDLQGRTVSTQYAAGERARIYIPLPGDELLMRCAAAAYTIGANLGPTTTTGVLGSVAAPTCFVSLEAVTLAEEELMLVQYVGGVS